MNFVKIILPIVVLACVCVYLADNNNKTPCIETKAQDTLVVVKRDTLVLIHPQVMQPKTKPGFGASEYRATTGSNNIAIGSKVQEQDEAKDYVLIMKPRQ